MMADIPPVAEAPAFVPGGLEVCARIAEAVQQRSTPQRATLPVKLDGTTAYNVLLPVAARHLKRNFLAIVIDRSEPSERKVEQDRFRDCLSSEVSRCEVRGPAAIVVGFKEGPEEFRLPSGATATVGFIKDNWLTCEAPWAPRAAY